MTYEKLDEAVDRFLLLEEEAMDKDRLDKLISACRELPIVYMEAAVAYYKRESAWLEKEVIPDLMLAENRRSIETTDGTKVSVRTELNVSQAGVEDLAPVVSWLEERGLGGIVKKRHYFNDSEMDDERMEYLRLRGIPVQADCSINTNTLKKTLKEHYDRTNELPDGLLKVSLFNHAVIKRTAKDE